MSKKEDSNNVYIIGGAVAAIAVIFGFFTFTSYNTNLSDNSVNIDKTSDKTLSVNKVIKTDKPEEIIVIGKSAQDTMEASKKDSLAVKANEAAVRTQVNEEMKSSENTDFLNAE